MSLSFYEIQGLIILHFDCTLLIVHVSFQMFNCCAILPTDDYLIKAPLAVSATPYEAPLRHSSANFTCVTVSVNSYTTKALGPAWQVPALAVPTLGTCVCVCVCSTLGQSRLWSRPDRPRPAVWSRPVATPTTVRNCHLADRAGPSRRRPGRSGRRPSRIRAPSVAARRLLGQHVLIAKCWASRHIRRFAPFANGDRRNVCLHAAFCSWPPTAGEANDRHAAAGLHGLAALSQLTDPLDINKFDECGAYSHMCADLG